MFALMLFLACRTYLLGHQARIPERIEVPAQDERERQRQGGVCQLREGGG
jgi:hypothetical protein